jgi:hypothetical protein
LCDNEPTVVNAILGSPEGHHLLPLQISSTEFPVTHVSSSYTKNLNHFLVKVG